MSEMQKPPLGIMPESLFLEQRLHDILEAISRYQEADMPIPPEWSDEMFRIPVRMIELQNKRKRGN